MRWEGHFYSAPAWPPEAPKLPAVTHHTVGRLVGKVIFHQLLLGESGSWPITKVKKPPDLPAKELVPSWPLNLAQKDPSGKSELL